MKKNDLILIGILGLIAVVSIAGMLLLRGKGAEVVVMIDGEEYARYNLDRNQTVELPGALGTNILTVQDGEAWMSAAVCPDKLCMHQGKIHYSSEMIVCLPGKIIVRIEGGEEPDIDAAGW